MTHYVAVGPPPKFELVRAPTADRIVYVVEATQLLRFIRTIARRPQPMAVYQLDDARRTATFHSAIGAGAEWSWPAALSVDDDAQAIEDGLGHLGWAQPAQELLVATTWER